MDFEAAYDGPTIPGAPSPIPIDDLVLCEQCLAEAFTILDPQNLRETIEELSQIVLDQQREIDEKDKSLQGFRATTNALIDYPPKSFPGKPRLEGVPEDVKEAITKARYSRRGSSTAPKKHWKVREKEEKEAAEQVSA